MRFPLNRYRVIRGVKEHLMAGLGAATDYEARYENLFAPFDGYVTTQYGTEGGNWLQIARPNGDRMKFAHLEYWIVNKGKVEEGQVMGVTGNSGTITTGPHLHLEVYINDERVNPELYFMDTITFNIIYIGREDTQELRDTFAYCRSKVRQFSSGRIDLGYQFRRLDVRAPQDSILEQVDAFNATKQVDIPQGTHGVFVCYTGDMEQPWYATYKWPGADYVITHAQTPLYAPGALFELKHQLIISYNARRGSRPFIDNIDIYTASEDIVKSQIEQITPYADALRWEEPMTRLEVDILYEMLAIVDADGSGRQYWTGKPLVEFLKVVARDKAAKFLELSQ